jgi:hypothetical protein
MKCEMCSIEHNGTYASGRFCSYQCSRRFSTASKRAEINSKISNTLKGRIVERSNTPPERPCEECGTLIRKYVSEGKKLKCGSCVARSPYVRKDISKLQLMDLSGRTISKIISRAKLKCSICGWDETIGDIHHIIHKKDGGTDHPSNLIYVCPNHHRVIHTLNRYDVEFLKDRCLEKTFPDRRDFYRGITPG